MRLRHDTKMRPQVASRRRLQGTVWSLNRVFGINLILPSIGLLILDVGFLARKYAASVAVPKIPVTEHSAETISQFFSRLILKPLSFR